MAYRASSTTDEKKKFKGIDWLFANMEKDNLVPDLDEDTVNAIGRQVVGGYEIDLQSRKDWQDQTEEGIKIAKQITEKKTFPWPGAANVKYPLIATASMQFAARSYPQIVNGTDIVKAQVVGEDPKGEKEAKAKRVSQHMSYQLLEQMPEWESDMDMLLHGLPVMGTYFKKTFFDPVYQRNRSIALTPLEVVVNNNHKGDMNMCRRITQEIWLYKNEVIERERLDLYTEGVSEHMQENEDSKAQELFLEQHCWYDLDDDGYEEPYIVTVHKESGVVARIRANYEPETMLITQDKKLKKIDPIEYFTKYIFIPSPDGCFYGVGFAHLLGPINETMSTIINQLLDAGALANTGGGFISRGIRWQGGNLSFKLGEWKPVDVIGGTLKDNIVPLPVREPSNVLFQLLGMLNEAGNKLASVSDMMSGETPSQNTPATTVLAVIEQGLKVFTSIYKRVFRAMKQEFKKLYRLNRLHMDDVEYIRVLDSQLAVFQKDYSAEDLDIVPVADPTMSSEAQKLARAQALLQSYQLNPDPVARMEILRQYYDAIGAKNLDMLANVQAAQQQAQQAPPPNPDLLRLQLETKKASDAADAEKERLHNETIELMARLVEMDAQIQVLKTQAVKNVADAESKEVGMQIDQYTAQAQGIKDAHGMQMENLKQHVEMMLATQMQKVEGEGAPAPQTGTQGVESLPSSKKETESPSAPPASATPEMPTPGPEISASEMGPSSDQRSRMENAVLGEDDGEY